MEKVITYHGNSTIQMQLSTQKRVAIQSSNQFAPVMDVKFPVETPIVRRMGRWLIECSKEHNNVFMRECITFQQSDCIVFSFEEGMIEVSFLYESIQEQKKEVVKNVKRIDVYPKEVGKIKITTQESNTVPRNRTTDKAESVQVRELQKELQKQQERNSYLQQMLERRMEDMIVTLQSSNEVLRMETQAKFTHIEKLKNEEEYLKGLQLEQNQTVEEIEQSMQQIKFGIEDAKIKKERLDAELEELNVRKEFLELDCESAKIQIEELKEQVSLDSDTLTLLEDGQRLKHGTISKSFAEIEKEIIAVENRIALILNFRSKFNTVVEDAILSGDGTISDSDELGGMNNGDRGTTPT